MSRELYFISMCAFTQLAGICVVRRDWFFELSLRVVFVNLECYMFSVCLSRALFFFEYSKYSLGYENRTITQATL